MKTFFEIIAGKTYSQLSTVEKDELQNRQTALVVAWQDAVDPNTKLLIEDELIASFKGLIKGIAYKQAEKSFSLDQEEFEGIISLVLAETMITFDRTLNKPFQPIFLMNVRYAILEMYRDKGYDLHDTSKRLDEPSNGKYDAESNHTYADFMESPASVSDEVETRVVTDEILTELFGDNDRKKTIVHMSLQGFKRKEIVDAVGQGKSESSTAKMVNRTVSEFKAHCLNLQEVHAL